MRCPYLSAPSEKRCVEMEKAGQQAEVLDFDMNIFVTATQSTATILEKLKVRKLKQKIWEKEEGIKREG